MNAITLLKEYCIMIRDCLACRWNEYDYLGQDDDDVYHEMTGIESVTVTSSPVHENAIEKDAENVSDLSDEEAKSVSLLKSELENKNENNLDEYMSSEGGRALNNVDNILH